jgi:hypothetical protein
MHATWQAASWCAPQLTELATGTGPKEQRKYNSLSHRSNIDTTRRVLLFPEGTNQSRHGSGCMPRRLFAVNALTLSDRANIPQAPLPTLLSSISHALHRTGLCPADLEGTAYCHLLSKETYHSSAHAPELWPLSAPQDRHLLLPLLLALYRLCWVRADLPALWTQLLLLQQRCAALLTKCCRRANVCPC